MKTVEYYKDNAEEDYLQTPISVLRYITELEQYANQSKQEKDKGLREAAEKVVESCKYYELEMISLKFSDAIEELEKALNQNK